MRPLKGPVDTGPAREKFATARQELSAALIERDDEVDLILTALIAGEHLMLVGPPGCGKSLLLDSLLRWTSGARFSILLTKFTTPEEVFGPVSLVALKADKYLRVTAGKLPEADYCFIDECFKGSSAVLNTLLKILNERVYDAGDGVVRGVPLQLCVAASNEWPSPDTGKELSALFDRFLLRKTVSPIRSQVGRQKLLWTRDHTPELSGTISPTALEVDAWGLRRGRDLIAESERLRQSGTDEFAAADFFQAAFDPDPRLHGACHDPRRHQFLSQLLDTPEYRSLNLATRLDDTASAIAATHFAEQFARLQTEDTKDRERGAAAGDDLGAEMAVLRAVGRAVAEADREVTELHETASALGMGPGTAGGNDPKTVAALFRRVRTDPTLRKICELAGRFRRVAQSKQRQKVSHGLDDVVGVEPGGDVGRLLPVELGQLMVPELELDTLRRIVERQTLCREHHAVEPVGKGPVIVCLDESGAS